MTKLEEKFRLLVDDTLLGFVPDINQEMAERKSVLSYLNDFESGKWRYRHFIDFIFNNICETALSEDERCKLVDEGLSSLRKSAKNLRISTDSGEGSELAEILLYGVMKHHYNALPVVPKIYYKQNTQDNAKGADSVHIVLEEDLSFSLWYGEAKFYTELKEAMKSAIASIKDMISDSKLRKENSIVTSMGELKKLVKNEEQYMSIKQKLSSDTSLDNIKPILHIPILILHECRITSNYTRLSKEYLNAMEKMYQEVAQRFFEKLDDECGDVSCYKSITFHLIPFPIPSKTEVVSMFKRDADFLRED